MADGAQRGHATVIGLDVATFAVNTPVGVRSAYRAIVPATVLAGNCTAGLQNLGGPNVGAFGERDDWRCLHVPLAQTFQDLLKLAHLGGFNLVLLRLLCQL